VNSRANKRFWIAYSRLPSSIKKLAQKNYRLWKENPRHPSLRFKEIKPRVWSARVGDNFRALAAFDGTTFVWFWIGSHDKYELFLKS